MPISGITTQPSSNSINAGYRPIVFTVGATGTSGGVPPVVYCDIYVNSVFYKTMSKTVAPWTFDIQDACQEVLKKFLEDNGESAVVEAPLACLPVMCKFRSSGLDPVEGFIVPEGTIPVQATTSSAAVGGSGTSSNTFYVVNATIQQEQNQDLATHLNEYKYGTWSGTTYPLTHRPNPYYIARTDSDSFPVLADSKPGSLDVHYTLCAGTTGTGGGTLPCLAPTISFALPNATVGTAYNHTYAIGGDSPFTLGTVEKPAWMTVAISGTSLVLGGTPASGDIATGIIVNIDITGCGGTITASDTMNVTDVPPACVPIDFTGDTFPTATSGSLYTVTITLTGTTPYSMAIVTKPAWMTVTKVGDTVTCTGTPSNADIPNQQIVTLNFSNACGTAQVNKIFNVHGTGQNVYVINGTTDTIVLRNSNGDFDVSSGGNLPMSNSFFLVLTAASGHHYHYLTSLPSTEVGNEFLTQGDSGNVGTLSNVNYIWIKET